MRKIYEGECHRVFVKPRENTSSLVVIEVEDDGQWSHEMSFDIAWLNDFEWMINHLYRDDAVRDELTDIAKRKREGTYYRR